MAWVLNNKIKDTLLQKCLLSTLYLFDSTFLGVVWTNNLQNYVK